MKALVIDGFKYCQLPEGVNNIDSAMKYLNKYYNSFIKVITWPEDKCVAPYFIDKYKKEECINVSMINSIELAEIEILSEKEYIERLEEKVKIKCCQCQHNDEEDDIDSYRDKMALDGKCLYFQKK